jgi:hypothetical protein
MSHGEKLVPSLVSATLEKGLAIGFAKGYSSAFLAGKRAEIKNMGGDLRKFWRKVDREKKLMSKFSEFMVQWGTGMKQDEELSHPSRKQVDNEPPSVPGPRNSPQNDLGIITAPLLPGANTYDTQRGRIREV